VKLPLNKQPVDSNAQLAFEGTVQRNCLEYVRGNFAGGYFSRGAGGNYSRGCPGTGLSVMSGIKASTYSGFWATRLAHRHTDRQTLSDWLYTIRSAIWANKTIRISLS